TYGTDTLGATIDWGDNTTSTGTVTPGAATDGTVNSSHTYDKSGTFTVTVTVADGYGGSTSQSFSVVVAHVPPVVYAGPDVSLNWGDGTVTALTLSWTAGSAGVSSVAAVSADHSYADVGTYTATLTLTDADGTQQTGTVTVTVANSPPTFVTAPGNQSIDQN